ncbi:MAG: ATP-binding protein, partial [Acidimicrobiia bacterium]
MATPETLVGRAAELAAVDAALGGALEGRTTTLLVAGEAGIGKTRLLEHLARLAAARAVPVLWGRATDDDGAPAYWPWRQVLRSWASGAGARAVEALGPVAADLSRIAPELSGGAPPRPAVAGEAGAGERFALFEACRALLEGTASRSGLVVVLDDLHWCDAASLLLLGHVVRHAREARLLVAGAFRPHDLARGPRAADIVAGISGQPSTVRLDLGGLAAGEVGEQLAGVMGRPVSADVVATVAMRTGGNPLFVREVGRLLASGSQGVPDAVRGAIGQRLGALGGGCRRVLAAAAVVGVDIDPHLVAAATGEAPDEVLGRLDVALAVGILARRPASLRYRFAHDLVRDCCALDLAGAERAAVHLAAAEHLAGPDGDGHQAEVAHHRVAALPWGDPGAASAAARRAAAAALGQLAFEDAARLYGWALEAASAAGAGAGRRARLLVDKAHAHHLANDSAPARAACEQAAALAEEAGDAEALGLAALVLEDTSEPEWLVTIQRWCRSALAGLGDADSALRAQLLAQEAMTWLVAGDASRMKGASAEALAMAERVGDRAALATALRARQLARSSPDGALERLELADRMSALGARPPDHGCAAVWGHLWRFDALMELGRVDDAEAELHHLEPVVARSRQPLARWHLLRSVTAVHIGRGRFAEATAVNAEALAIARAGGDDGAVGTTRVQRALVSVLTGDRLEDLGAELRRALPGPWQPMVLALAAEWYLVSGRPEEAAGLYRALPPPTWRPPP